MDRYYGTMEQNQLNQVDSLRKQSDYWKQMWDQALSQGDTQSAKRFEENYKKTLSNLNNVIQDAANTIKNKYTNSINSIFDELDKKIT